MLCVKRPSLKKNALPDYPYPGLNSDHQIAQAPILSRQPPLEAPIGGLDRLLALCSVTPKGDVSIPPLFKQRRILLSPCTPEVIARVN